MPDIAKHDQNEGYKLELNRLPPPARGQNLTYSMTLFTMMVSPTNNSRAYHIHNHLPYPSTTMYANCRIAA